MNPDIAEQLVGFLVINKPADKTSYDCIRALKRIIKHKIKIGHAGTLDPFATGIMIIGIGRAATRHFHQLMGLDKKYTAYAKFGELTDTLDRTGSILQSHDVTFTSGDLDHAIAALGNAYEQIPPIYSALQYNGKRLYHLARKKNSDPEMLATIAAAKKRLVHIYACSMRECTPSYATIDLHVSHGTYVRSVINDIASHMKTVGTTYELMRTAINTITLSDATHLHELQSIDDLKKQLISVDDFLARIRPLDN